MMDMKKSRFTEDQIIGFLKQTELVMAIKDGLSARRFLRSHFLQMAQQIWRHEYSYEESFNARFHNECLDEHVFDSLTEARQIIVTWRYDYNQVRPHGSIGRILPAVFAASSRRSRQQAGDQPVHNHTN